MQAQLDAFEAAGEKAALIDAPLLFEAGLDSLCDLTVAVLADEEVRLARIMARDGVDREAALRRMAVQPKAAFYRSRANDILYNDGDPAQLEQQIAQLLEKIGRWCG
jgi:dephospho-CoA kinase